MTLRLINGAQPAPMALSFFDSVLDRTGARQLQALATPVGAARGEVLAQQGEVGNELFVLSEGFVKLWKAMPDGRRQIVAFRAAGDLISLHRRDTPWPVTVEAVSYCELFRIEWEALRGLAGRYPAIDRALLDMAGDEIAGLQDRLLMLGRKSTEEKLASLILEFCRPSAAAMSLSREIHLPMRRPDIAEYLGLTTESVSREFSRPKRERIIAMPRPSRIIVLNRPALEAIALGASHQTVRPNGAGSSNGAHNLRRPADAASRDAQPERAGLGRW